MRSVLRVIPLFLTTQLWAVHGIVQTTGDETFEGEIQFAAGALLIRDANAVTNIVKLEKLALLRAQPPSQMLNSTNSVQGLRAAYFTNETLTGKSIMRIDPVIDFNWQEGAPTNGVGPDHFSVRWEGQVKAPVAETFTFAAQADDGVRLWVNNQLLIDRWQEPSPGEWTGSIDLKAGKNYDLKMEYVDREGPALAKLFWSSLSVPKSIIPREQLSSLIENTPTNSMATNAAAGAPRNGLLGMYFNESDLSGEFKLRYDPVIEFDSTEGPPMNGINANKFSVRWTGKLVPQFSQHYTFHTLTDDGVRLWLDNKLIIDSWSEESMHQSSIPMILEGGMAYPLRMEAFHIGARWMAKLSWSSPSTPFGVVPFGQLLPAAAPDPAVVAAAKRKTPVGVVLAGGSVIARRIHSADDTAIRFSESAGEPALSTVNVARIILQPLIADMETKLQPGRAGLLLNSKDFIDGEFRGINAGRIKMNSVLFGIKSYPSNQVIAIVLRDLKPAAVKYEVRTRDESLLLANDLRIEKDRIAFGDPVLAGLKVSAAELLELKCRPQTH